MSDVAATKYDYRCVAGLPEGRRLDCPNMKDDPNDTSMESERYVCDVCGDRVKLYYEDMA